MRVMVHRAEDGVRQYVVIPGRARHLAPIALRGADELALRQALRQVVEEIAAQPTPSPPVGAEGTG